MAETIAQYAGMAWCTICIVCIVWTFGTYIVGSEDRPGKRNKKIMDNMNKLEKR